MGHLVDQGAQLAGRIPAGGLNCTARVELDAAGQVVETRVDTRRL